jgi:hypothetical protein
MKTFRQLFSEVAQPRGEDERHFKDKHIVTKKAHPVAPDNVFTGGTKKAPKRLADYDVGEDETVYEASVFDVPTAAGGEYDEEESHKKYKRGNKSVPLRKESKMDPVGQEDDDINNDGKVDAADRYLHRRRKAISKAIKKEEAEQIDENLEKETVKHPLGKRPNGPGWVLKKAGEQSGKDHNVWERKFKRVGSTITKEESEQIDEVSGSTLGSYYVKAAADRKKQVQGAAKAFASAMGSTADVKKAQDQYTKHNDKANKRQRGMNKAMDKLTGSGFARVHAKEEVEDLDEVSKDLLGRYATKALQRGDIANRMSKSDSDEMGKISNKRFSGVKKAVDKMATKSGNKRLTTSIKKDVDATKASGSAYSRGTGVDDQGKSYNRARRNIGKMREEVEQIDEISDKKLDAYRQKAFADQPSGDDGSDKYRKRKFGRDLAFAKQTGRAKVRATKEEVEQIDEISKKTLGSYIKKAKTDVAGQAYQLGARDPLKPKASWSKALGREKYIDKAVDRLTKEEAEIDEAAPKIKPDFLKTQREKDREHDASMGRTPTGRKKVMTSTQRSIASMRNEEVEQLDELSPNKLHAYIKGASADMKKHASMAGYDSRSRAYGNAAKNAKRANKRMDGITSASGRLADKANADMYEDLDESITKMSHGRLKFHLNTSTPHGSYSNDDMKSERDRRLKTGEGEAYRKAKASLSEVTRSAVKRPVTYTDATGRTRTRYTTTRPVQRDQHGQEKIQTNESFINEAFKAGSVRLNDGSAVSLKAEDAKLLNQMFKDLNERNRKTMRDTLMTDKSGFNEILSFAREAL